MFVSINKKYEIHWIKDGNLFYFTSLASYHHLFLEVLCKQGLYQQLQSIQCFQTIN